MLVAAPARAQDGGVAPTAEELEISRALTEDASAAEKAKAAPSPLARALQSFNPELSLITDVALAAFSSRAPLQTGAHDPTARGFNLQVLELTAAASVDPYFHFDIHIAFAQFGVEIEEAFATSLALPNRFQLRIGQFLTRFGRLNPTHPHSWNFVDQPFALGRLFGGEGNRGVGVEGSWLLPLPWYAEAVGSVTEASGAATARSFLGGSGLGVEHPGDFQFTAALKQFFEPHEDWSILWGLSGANGPNATGHANRTDVLGTDLYVKFRPLAGEGTTVVSLQTEWFYRRRQVSGDVLSDLTGYAELFWRFTQRFAAAARYELGTPALGRNGFVADDPLDPEWTDVRERGSANLTFWPTEFSRFRLQAAVDAPRFRPALEYSVFLAAEFSIGAHGAHGF
jgi:hypothetical protein